MGGYERWLVARGNVFAPSSEAVAKLIETLRSEEWIIPTDKLASSKLRFVGRREEQAKKTGGYAVKTVENTFGEDESAKVAASTEPQPVTVSKDWLDDPDREELRLVWPVDGDEPLPVKYPLSHKPDGESRRYAIEIHRALEYVYPSSSSIKPLPSVCRCGEDLSFAWDDEEVVPAFRSSTGIFAECDECSRTFDPAKETATIKNPFDGSKEKVVGGGAYRFAMKVDCFGKDFANEPKLTFAPALVALIEKEFGRSFYEFGSLY